MLGWQPSIYTYGVVLYRGLMFCGALAGLYLLGRSNLPAGFLLRGLLQSHPCPGAAGYSRYAVPRELLEIILAGTEISRRVGLRQTKKLILKNKAS